MEFDEITCKRLILSCGSDAEITLEAGSDGLAQITFLRMKEPGAILTIGIDPDGCANLALRSNGNEHTVSMAASQTSVGLAIRGKKGQIALDAGVSPSTDGITDELRVIVAGKIIFREKI